jgi:hypothetical protein
MRPTKDNTALQNYFRNNQTINMQYRLKGGAPFSWMIQNPMQDDIDEIIKKFTSSKLQRKCIDAHNGSSVTVGAARTAVIIHFNEVNKHK